LISMSDVALDAQVVLIKHTYMIRRTIYVLSRICAVRNTCTETEIQAYFIINIIFLSFQHYCDMNKE
jgi:hypothetical protein